MRQAWANRVLRERERQLILGGVKGSVGVLGNHVQVVGGAIGQRVHGVTERIPLGFFGHSGRTPGRAGTTASPGVPAVLVEGAIQDPDQGFDMGIDTEGVGGMNVPKRKSVLQGTRGRNLDDIIGGSRLRASQPGSVLFDGTPGVEETLSVRRREGVGIGNRESWGSGLGRSDSGTHGSGGGATRNGQSVGEPVLNRGTMASQTVVQRQYGPTAPMTIGSSIPHDYLADYPPPAYK